MSWVDIAAIVLSCTLANHTGLVETAEALVKHSLPIVNCPKCCTFWCVLAYTVASGTSILHCVAISFLCAYAAVWVMLLFGLIDTLYNLVYENTFTTEAAEETDTTDAVS